MIRQIDISRRMTFDKALHDKAFAIASNLKYNRYQRELTSIVTNLIIKLGNRNL